MWHGSMGSRSCLRVGAALVLILLTAAAALLPGCAQSTAEKQKQYRSQYEEIIDAFQAQVARDDKQAGQLGQSNDLAALIKLNNRRLNNVNETFDKLLLLYPPGGLRAVHALTLYYLVAVTEQLQAQNDYLEAVLAGKPSTDLQSIATSATSRIKALSNELALDLQKANITIKNKTSEGGDQSQSAPSSSGSGGGAR
jgi:hypothetical protein